MKVWFFLVLCCGLLFPVSAFAADVKAGKKAARVCTSCHGDKGISKVDSYPSLAGQPAAYLEKQLRDFKAGSRSDVQMTFMARRLNEQDILNISAWYSQLPAFGGRGQSNE